jgi:hypothetical protein
MSQEQFSPPCPYCKSAEKLDYDTPMIDGNEASQKCYCGICGSEWSEVYIADYIEGILVTTPHPDAPKEE